VSHRTRLWLLAALLAGGCTCEEPRTGVPTYRAPKAAQAPVIDGRLDEPAWQRAPQTEAFVQTMTGDPGEPATRARLTWDDDALYVAFEVEDDYLHAELTGHDPHLWTEDTVEIMVDPDGDGSNYFELQLAPNDQVFDTRYDARRVPRPFGHTGWDSHMRGAVSVEGTLDDEEPDGGYVAEMAIPWSAFEAGPSPADRPEPGQTWRVALYVLDYRPQGQRGVGWSAPLVGDFHVPERFGRVIFEER